MYHVAYAQEMLAQRDELARLVDHQEFKARVSLGEYLLPFQLTSAAVHTHFILGGGMKFIGD